MSDNPSVNRIAEIGNMNLCRIALKAALNRQSSLPGLVLFHGPTGYGKSMSATAIANEYRAFYVQAKSVWTMKHFLKAILAEMSILPAGTIPEMADQAAEELAASRRPLIIDEMDHIVRKGFVDLVRDLYESSQSPILLIGEENLPVKLAKNWPQFYGRTMNPVEALPANMADAQKLRDVYCADVSVADDLLAYVLKSSHGSTRRVCVNLAAIRDCAINEGTDAVDLAAWGNKPLHNGDAPKPRAK